MGIGLQERVQQIVGKACCRKHVGLLKSLSLEFGKVGEKSQPANDVIGEWKLGTFRCAWRVIGGGRVLCGSQDAVDSIDELTFALNQIDLGRFKSLRQVGDFDVRLDFDNGFIVDFLATLSDDDECFHIFCPDNVYIKFSLAGGWCFGPSNKPWTRVNPAEDREKKVEQERRPGAKGLT